MTVTNFDILRCAIASALLTQGWEACDGTAVVMRHYETAVGVKPAFIYVAEFRNEPNCMVTGDYQSAQGNALDSACVLIPKDASPQEIDRLTKQFSDRANQLIDESFARGLFLRRQQPTC